MSEHARMFVDGAWVESESGALFDAVSPSTGEVIGSVPEGTRLDVQHAVDAAARAWPAWAALSAFDRATAMERVAETIDAQRDELARTLSLDQGKPLRAEAHDEVEELIAYFSMAAADARRVEGLIPSSVDANKRVLVYRVPRGVVGLISPWNWPYTMPGEILAPALAYGNAVVWAPAPTTSICAVRMAECLEAAELPAGVFNMVTGPGPVVGDEIAANPGTAAVGFIGSIATGNSVAQRAGGKELLLEMGGNGPLVVLEDADVDAAVQATLVACFLNAGQSCTAGERILVHEDVREEYVARLAAVIDTEIHLGDPFDDATTMGPVNNEPTAAKTERHVGEAIERGATLVAGGRRAPELGSGLFYEATVVDGVTGEMEIAREETFGPVAPISSIRSEDEAIALVNGSPYGLLSAVFTRDLRRGLRYAEAVRAGWVNVNEGTNYWESHLPFGGRAGSSSGVGRVGGRFSMERLTELKTIVINLT
ncbi:MAG TPA: aldehyde dehydrogenase family protein [Actinomycetota bacterium]|jgi:succinate-semialdehyde dehydrogenase/glutarate-semialdehyde dehydrogenase|nr:aldehyde dehydrogenase family protein [Actinomycetota bacterium]